VIFSHYFALKNIFLSVAFAFMLAHINLKIVTRGLFTCTRESFRYHLMNLLIASFKFSSRVTYSYLHVIRSAQQYFIGTLYHDALSITKFIQHRLKE
jgi:hypothetical protein